MVPLSPEIDPGSFGSPTDAIMAEIDAPVSVLLAAKPSDARAGALAVLICRQLGFEHV